MKYTNVIGRQHEITQIEQILQSKKSEFCAIYGRRRVGKSFLVDEVCGKKIVFSAVGTYTESAHLSKVLCINHPILYQLFWSLPLD